MLSTIAIKFDSYRIGVAPLAIARHGAQAQVSGIPKTHYVVTLFRSITMLCWTDNILQLKEIICKK